MAMQPARSMLSDHYGEMPQYYPPPRKPRIVWPWPVFLLGLAALAAVWIGRPYWRPTDGDRAQRDVAEMRNLLNRSSPDLNRAMAIGRKLLDLESKFPQYSSETHFLMGCAHARKAEDSAESDLEWKEARQHFEKAEQGNLAIADQPRLAFRLAKAIHLTGGDPKLVLEKLKKADDAEFAAERWQMIAEIHANAPQPNLAEAIAATQAQIPLIGPNDVKTRAKAYYRLADLYLRKNELQPALNALQEIRAAEAPEIYDASRVLVARSEQANGRFVQAAQAWEQLRAKSKPPVDRGVIAYELGYCYLKAGRPDDARKVWSEVQGMSGEAVQAAQLRLAEIQLSEAASRPRAAGSLEEALKDVRKPADYRNTLFPLAQARQMIEKACQEFRTAGDFASAGKMADLLIRLSGPGRARELAAETAAAWGVALQSDAKKLSGLASEHALEEANKQFRLAASIAAEVAGSERPATEQAEWLRKAAGYYLKCSEKADIQSAVGLLDRLMQLGAGQANGEVLYLKAVANEHLDEREKAIEGYRACLEGGHPCQARARYQLSRLMLAEYVPTRTEDQQKLDQAADELAKNLDMSVRESEPEVAEMSAYLLGHMAYTKKDWLKAETHLSRALREFPSSHESLHARFLLGRCYWWQAGKESQTSENSQLPVAERNAAKKRMKELLAKSAGVFEPLEDELLKLDREQKLTDENRKELTQTCFAAAECHFFMEEFDGAIQRYNILRIRFAGQVNELIALSQLWQCYRVYQNDLDRARTTVSAMRDLLKSLPADVFNGSTKFHRREFWEEWLNKIDPPATASPVAPPKEP